MAWATKCDRCGKYFDWHSNTENGFAVLTFDVGKCKYSIEGEEYDLCPDCVKDLYDWFNRRVE